MGSDGHLVLERRVNQSIIIESESGDVEVVVAAVKLEEGKSPRVKLLIKAPRSTTILRKELAVEYEGGHQC